MSSTRLALLVTVTWLIASACASHPAADLAFGVHSPDASCVTALNAERDRLSTQPGRAPLRTLKEQELRCYGLDATSAKFMAQVITDAAAQAHALLNEPATAASPLFFVDRNIKREKFLADAGFREAYARGDQDEDLIPDSLDRCPDTTPGATTDEEGCEYDCVTGDIARSRRVTMDDCRRFLGSVPSAEDRERVAETLVPINLNCAESPVPSTSSVLGWAPVVTDKIVQGLTTTERRAIKLFAVRSDNTIPGCELFYEFDLRFTTPGGTSSGSLLFSGSEDRSAENPDIATFLVPTAVVVSQAAPPGPFSASASYSAIPLPPGRASARDQFVKATSLTWRVRTINGLGATGGWSSFRSQVPGADLTP